MQVVKEARSTRKGVSVRTQANLVMATSTITMSIMANLAPLKKITIKITSRDKMPKLCSLLLN